MDIFTSDASPVVVWVVLPLVIFAARTCDMALSTLRIVFIAQGRSALSALTGFFESLIWLLVVSQALANLHNPLCVAAYAGGFAMGNVVGIKFEERLALGLRILRVILAENAPQVAAELRAEGFAVTEVEGEGRGGPVKILFALVRRSDVGPVIERVNRHNPDAFVTVEEVRQVARGHLPLGDTFGRSAIWPPWRKLVRKGK